jgi:hypothetical protein
MSAISGELQAMELADVLEWMTRRSKTGTLHLTWRSTHKKLIVRDGKLDATASNDPRDVLGQFLVRDGLVSEQQLFEALLQQEKDRRMLGAILIGQGLIGAEQLTQTLRVTAEETLYGAFLWPEGRFEFHDWEDADTPLPLSLDLAPLIEEGSWRQAEWERMRETLPTLDVSFRPRPGGTPPAEADSRRLYELANGGYSLSRMSLETRRSPFETASHLLALCEQGVLEVDPSARQDTASDVVAAIDQFHKTATARLKDGRFDQALTAYENVLALDPLNQQAKKGVVAVGEARRRARAGSKVPLDKVPVLKLTAMALTKLSFDPQEGFVLSRINGEWNVRAILKLCPLPEDEALVIFARLMEQKVIDLT